MTSEAPTHTSHESESVSTPRQVDSEDAEGDETAVASDAESFHEQVEVFFDDKDAQRRRASLNNDRNQQGLANKKKISSFFVHNLLEQHASLSDGFQKLATGSASSGDLPSSLESPRSPRDQQKGQRREQGDGMHSRLLTKKQIREMAFGIRELSQQLGHLRVMLKIRNVFILTKALDKALIAKTRDMASWLLGQKNSEGHQYHVWVERTMQDDPSFDAASLFDQDASFKSHLHYWTNSQCAQSHHNFDLCLALGGDGTVLYASWLFQKVVPPVMSFALGSLGFLTKFDFDDHPNILDHAFRKGVTVSVRLRFEATIMRSSRNIRDSVGEPIDDGQDTNKRHDHDGESRDLIEELIGTGSDDPHTHKPDGTHNILNDIVLDRGPNGTMTTIEVFGDDDHFTTVQADGICVATPTGSTAYNLAAGGSLCHPDNPVILVTAIAPHTLSFRPIILPDTMILRLGVPYDARASCWASFDGKERSELKPGDYVTVSASRFPFPSILPLERHGEDWVRSISRTLNWNSRQRQKAFDDKHKSKDAKQ